MKNIVGLKFKNKLYKFIFAFIFTSVLVLTVPGGSAIVYAAPLEDCDLDGFDDATGVPVPWPGYDETKGDTPDGPAGSKTTPTTAPASTAENSKDSGTPSKISGTETDKTDSTKTDSTKIDSTKTDNTKADTTNSQTTTKSGSSNPGKTNSTTGEKTATTATSKTSTSTAASTKSTTQDKNSSTVKSDTTQSDTNKESSTTSASSSVSDKSNGTSNVDGNKMEASTDSITSEPSTNNADALSSEESNETVQDEEEQTDANIGDGETLENDSEKVVTDNTKDAIVDVNAVIHTKGILDITETNGSMVHVGSTVNILGSGFTQNIQNLEIQIQSEAKQLGFVNSSEAGSFEAQFNIPTDIEAGTHNIVVLYEGNEISRQQIQIGPKAADSFLQALTVGFSSENNGMVPGVLILLGLIVVGIGAVGFNALIRPSKAKR